MVISLILNIILLGALIIFYINTSKKKSYERILCAAIKRKEPTYDNADFSDDHLCILGYRNYNIIHYNIIYNLKDLIDKSPKAEGFYTSKGRFVDRAEAYKIAKKAGQIRNNNKRSRPYLFSEDLY